MTRDSEPGDGGARDTDGRSSKVASTRPEPEYLTPGQVARMLHVSPKTVNRWADQGRIGCIVTLGGHRRFARRDVAAVVEQMAAMGSARTRE